MGTVGTFSRNNPLRQANYDVCHDVVDPTYTVVGRGVPNLPMQYVFNFRDVDVPIHGKFDYTINEAHELFTGYQFTQVYSESNPQGAVRGQLSQIDPIPRVTVTGRMDANQVGIDDSTARGCILVAYDCPTRTMEYLVFHSVSQPIRFEARAAPPGFSGPLLFSIDGSAKTRSPLYGSKVLTEEEEWILYAEQMYFQLYSFNHPRGEIRGQLTTQFDYFAYLTGIQMVPSVTTANLGCATFDMTNLNYRVDFEIMHSIKDPIAVELLRGPMGVPGEQETAKLLDLSSRIDGGHSPLIGGFIVDDDDQVSWVTGNSFIQVSSPEFPYGEIRGQVLRIKPCDPNPLPYSVSSTTFDVSGTLDNIIDLPIVNSAVTLYFSFVLIGFLALFAC